MALNFSCDNEFYANHIRSKWHLLIIFITCGTASIVLHCFCEGCLEIIWWYQIHTDGICNRRQSQPKYTVSQSPRTTLHFSAVKLCKGTVSWWPLKKWCKFPPVTRLHNTLQLTHNPLQMRLPQSILDQRVIQLATSAKWRTCLISHLQSHSHQSVL